MPVPQRPAAAFTGTDGARAAHHVRWPCSALWIMPKYAVSAADSASSGALVCRHRGEGEPVMPRIPSGPLFWPMASPCAASAAGTGTVNWGDPDRRMSDAEVGEIVERVPYTRYLVVVRYRASSG